MSTELNIDEAIRSYAAFVSNQQLGLVHHLPEPWAKLGECFANVFEQVKRKGGRFQPGWMFHSRYVTDIPGPGYIIFSHHAVWHSPNGTLIDITPFHNEIKHQPLTVQQSVLFLVDDKAQPLVIRNRLTALPLRFFPLSDDERLLSYIQKLAEDEETKAQSLYDYMDTLPIAASGP
jgi:hypothetical protein